MKRHRHCNHSDPAWDEAVREYDLQSLFKRTAPDLGPVDVDTLFAASASAQEAKTTPAFVTWRRAVRELATAAFGVENPSSTRMARSTIMRARIAAIAVLVGSVSVFLLILGQPDTNSVFASVQEKLKEVRSVRFDGWTRWGDEAIDAIHVSLLGEDLGRLEQESDGAYSVYDRKRRKSMTVLPDQRKVLVYTDVEGENPIPNLFDMILSASARSVEELGDREIDGKRLKGFVAEIQGDKMNVWVDPTTMLPVLAEERHALEKRVERIEPRTKQVDGTFEAGTVIETVFTNFQYNIELDPAQFRLEPPKGYAIEQREMPGAEKSREARRAVEEARERARRKRK